MRIAVAVVVGFYLKNIAHPTGARFGSGVRFGNGGRFVNDTIIFENSAHPPVGVSVPVCVSVMYYM